VLNIPGDAIRIEAIAKSFANVPVLQDVTLRVRVGEIMALVGSNGSGKTTLLEILATLQLPTAGRATVGGFEVGRQARQIRRIVGYCAAGAESFYPQLTGRANLEFFAALHGLSPQEARTRTSTVLKAMGTSAVGDVAVQRYSAGMKQRLSLARALLGDAPILLLDEPTRSLDGDARCEFHRFLRQTLVGTLNKTVLMVTHDSNEASAVCDRVAVLSGGTIARVRTVDDAAPVLVAAHSAAG
jgi:ABC-2 type transport system ATP-binding protein